MKLFLGIRSVVCRIGHGIRDLDHDRTYGEVIVESTPENKFLLYLRNGKTRITPLTMG